MENKSNLVTWSVAQMDAEKGWLQCHPGGFSHADETNIMGR
jgi:hypothetical protein